MDLKTSLNQLDRKIERQTAALAATMELRDAVTRLISEQEGKKTTK